MGHSIEPEFRRFVLTQYEPLIEEYRLREFSPPDGDSSKFSVWLANDTTAIRVQGIMYGTAAMLEVFMRDGEDLIKLPISHFLQERAADDATQSPPDGQREEIIRDAILLSTHGQDVLRGDFTEILEHKAQQEKARAEKLAKRPSREERLKNGAYSEAGHAFRAGEFQKVVDLLSPYKDSLPKSQKRRYEQALKALKG